jgi:uncharacterized phage protein gp47/JayE
MSEYGVTEHGFKRKTYDEILESMKNRAQSLFGDDVNVTSASPLGLFVRLFAWSISLIWAVAEKVYNSTYVDTATNQSLDYVATNLNIERKGPKPSEGEILINGTPGTEIDQGFMVETDNDSSIRFETKYSPVIESGGSVTVPIRAKESGAHTNVPANTITVITNPASGIDSVNNPTETEMGRDRETDTELRDRYYNQLAQNSTDIIQAISSAINDLDGTKQVKPFENDTMSTDDLGVPPKSVFTVVLGGDDQEIAETIYKAKPGGIQAYGGTYITVTDIAGNEHQVGFSRPTSKDIYFKIDLKTNDDYPIDGDDQIKQGIVEYIEDLIIDNDVIHSKIINTIYNSCEGIDDFELYIGTSSGPTAKDNIDISGLEVAETTADKVVVDHV